MPGGKVFSDWTYGYIRAIRCVKNGCSVFDATGYCNNHPVMTGRNIDSAVNFYRLIKFCLLNLYTEFSSVWVHELIIWWINTLLQIWMNPPVFASSGGMFWRRTGRQRQGHKNTCILHCWMWIALPGLNCFSVGVYPNITAKEAEEAIHQKNCGVGSIGTAGYRISNLYLRVV